MMGYNFVRLRLALRREKELNLPAMQAGIISRGLVGDNWSFCTASAQIIFSKLSSFCFPEIGALQDS